MLSYAAQYTKNPHPKKEHKTPHEAGRCESGIKAYRFFFFAAFFFATFFFAAFFAFFLAILSMVTYVTKLTNNINQRSPLNFLEKPEGKKIV